MTPKRLLAVAPVAPLAGAAVLFAQIMRAAHRKDLPSHPNQDPSGDFGDIRLPRLRLVALGDSSITAPGVENLDECFVRRIAINLSDRYRVELRSVAVGGAKARDVLETQVDRALALEPTVALVSVGSNDAIRATPVFRYEADLAEIIERLHSRVGAVAIMGVGDLGTVPRLPPTLRAVLTMRAKAIDGAAERVAARFDRTAKSENWGLMADVFRSGDPRLFAGDRFHASGLGHKAFADGALPAVEAVLPLAIARRPAAS